MEYNFKKIHTGKDLALSFGLIVSGAGLFFLNKGLGITVAMCGILALLIYKTGYKLEGKSTLFTKRSEDICRSCKPSLVEFLNGNDVVPLIKTGTEGGSFRMDIYFNRAEGIAYAQLFDFTNYAYEKATDMVELHNPKAETLLSQLK